MANIFLCSYFAEVASKINEVVKFQGKDIVFIDTAAKFEEVNFYVDEAVEILENFGAKLRRLDVSCFQSSAVPVSSQDKPFCYDKILATINECDIIYISGGNTFYLLNELRKSRAAQAIKNAVKAGKIYIGESAGAIVAAPDTRYATLMDENSQNMSDFTGLNLVDVYVVPHFGCEPFAEATHEIMEKFGNLYDLRPINNAEFIAL
ncbi:type 1 glutamine amidotransferase-like domain-containing protein [Campylobacter concisus]|uniref:Type 1 glutamine amidotransferase-like domain-containing protein n=1 Tax=Campylobacter concisus TaxID=199 RepID=UPI0018AAE697|nr:Type 1 glutamine amidotransferase-like domain-containing protein [Campylobacter concisus]QPH99531.1 type 1 glutamine amidotransferase-like domain-containing protein [Campylobacter concisus]QPI01327.1 type 1 glutamine amidotransferase-like domain-containing protein [Campylobacter concisus]